MAGHAKEKEPPFALGGSKSQPGMIQQRPCTPVAGAIARCFARICSTGTPPKIAMLQ
jgi:hypothetical protein